MSEFDQFCLRLPECELSASLGSVTVRVQGQVIHTSKYVVGDYDDKLQETIRCYQQLIRALIGAKLVRPYTFDEAKYEKPEPLAKRESLDELLESPKDADPKA